MVYLSNKNTDIKYDSSGNPSVRVNFDFLIQTLLIKLNLLIIGLDLGLLRLLMDNIELGVIEIKGVINF